MHDFVQRIQKVLAFKRLVPGGRFKQKAAKREDVRALIDLFHTPLRLLRRHVTGGAHHHAGQRLLRHDPRAGLTRPSAA